MTTVLIVDDEALAIEAIRRSVNWEILGIDRVLDAPDGKEAQHILQQENVQLLVCDLEMPRMNGIELLEWTHAACPDVKSVILTCHESFSMAKKAMEFGCVEYVLKPIAPIELTASIRRALSLWNEQKSMRDKSKAYDKGYSLRRDQYLQDVLEKNILSTSESLFNCAQKLDLDIDFGEAVRIALISVPLADSMPISERELIFYGVCNIAKELWDARSSGWTSLLRRGATCFLLIGTRMQLETFPPFEKDLAAACQKTFRQQIVVDCAPPCNMLLLCSTADALERKATAETEPKKVPEDPRVMRWKELLLQGNYNQIQNEITAELSRLPSYVVSKRMKNLSQHLLHASRLALEQRGHLSENGDFVCTEKDVESVPQFLSWVQWLFSEIEPRLRHAPEEDQVIRRIREYIDLNLHQELTRESIAAAIFLNPDYTARLFKRKTGQSLNDYVQEKRISLARQLLAGTDMPIGDLAISLGYSSFSHFTKLFKSIEGVTPSDYRKQHAHPSK